MSIKESVRKWRTLDWCERGLLLEAALWLAIAVIWVRWLPFKRIARTFDRPVRRSKFKTLDARIQKACRIAWAIEIITHHFPWRSSCLVQVIVAQKMLAHRGIPGTIFLGVIKDQSELGYLKAHAWLSCEGKSLIGSTGHEFYTVISQFNWRIV